MKPSQPSSCLSVFSFLASVFVRAVVRVPVRVTFSVLLSLLVSSSPAPAQYPRPTRYPFSSYDLAVHITTARFTRIVIVDSGGGGDFKKISDALTYVSAQHPSFSSPWTIAVYPGNSYAEPSLTIPPFTILQGFSAPGTRSIQPFGRSMIQITGTTGSGITLSLASSIVDLGFNFTGILTAGYKGIDIPTSADDTTLTRVMIFVSDSAPNIGIDIISITGGSLTLEDSAIQRGGNGMTATRHVFCSAGSAVLSSAWLLASSAQAAVVETAGGAIRILHSRIFGDATVDLKNTSGMLSADQVSYATESGAITRAGVLSPRITLGGATVPPACTPPEIYVDSTSSARLCACKAANTWACAALK